jgi:DNA-binding IclR family transcriptional regulator
MKRPIEMMATTDLGSRFPMQQTASGRWVLVRAGDREKMEMAYTVTLADGTVLKSKTGGAQYVPAGAVANDDAEP